MFNLVSSLYQLTYSAHRPLSLTNPFLFLESKQRDELLQQHKFQHKIFNSLEVKMLIFHMIHMEQQNIRRKRETIRKRKHIYIYIEDIYRYISLSTYFSL